MRNQMSYGGVTSGIENFPSRSVIAVTLPMPTGTLASGCFQKSITVPLTVPLSITEPPAPPLSSPAAPLEDVPASVFLPALDEGAPPAAAPPAAAPPAALPAVAVAPPVAPRPPVEFLPPLTGSWALPELPPSESAPPTRALSLQYVSCPLDSPRAT